MSIRGSVDSITTNAALGWLFSAQEKQPLTVEAVLLGRIIGEAEADEHRADLAAAGFGDGRCGFTLNFYSPVESELLPMVVVRPRGGDVEVPRFAMTGFAEYFRAIQSRFPGAGRSRSIVGGLWTDRTDADRLLNGRIATGATPLELEPTLRSFINDGYVVLPGALAPVGISAAEASLLDLLGSDEALRPQDDLNARRFLEALPAALFREMPLRTLRAVLDDNPLATRTTVVRFGSSVFQQPSTAQVLPSPTETVLVVMAAGDSPVEIDIVRGSHALPEFSTDGRSRWLSAQASASIEIAIARGASVETISVGALDYALLGPGTLHRVRPTGTATAVLTWVLPQRQTPASVLQDNEGQFRVKHYSGAALIA